MLSAKNELGETLIAHHHSRSDLIILRKKHRYTCLECQAKVILKIGQTRTPHFSHVQQSKCRQQFGESEFHYRGKIQLYQWLRSQFTAVYLEHYLADLQQIPDIYIETENKRFAVEFQCAKIPIELVRARTEGYLVHNIVPIWILGSNQFKRKGRQKIVINHFLKNFIHQFPRNQTDCLLFYCPNTFRFVTLSNIMMISQTQALGQINFHGIQGLHFPQLLNTPQINHASIYRDFQKLKAKLRYSKPSITWQHYLYESGFSIVNMPSLIFLPTSSSYYAKVALWEWQAMFIIECFMPMPLNKVFELSYFIEKMTTTFHSSSTYPLINHAIHPLQAYLDILTQLGYLKVLPKEGTYQKIKHVKLTLSIDEILIEERLHMDKLIEMNNRIEK